MSNPIKRRNFLRLGAAAASFFGFSRIASGRSEAEDQLARILESRPAAGKPVIGLQVKPIPQVRVAVIGLGNRGEEHVRLVNAIGTQKARITAICDVREEVAKKSFEFLQKKAAEKLPFLSC